MLNPGERKKQEKQWTKQKKSKLQGRMDSQEQGMMLWSSVFVCHSYLCLCICDLSFCSVLNWRFVKPFQFHKCFILLLSFFFFLSLISAYLCSWSLNFGFLICFCWNTKLVFNVRTKLYKTPISRRGKRVTKECPVCRSRAESKKELSRQLKALSRQHIIWPNLILLATKMNACLSESIGVYRSIASPCNCTTPPPPYPMEVLVDSRVLSCWLIVSESVSCWLG